MKANLNCRGHVFRMARSIKVKQIDLLQSMEDLIQNYKGRAMLNR